MNTPDVLMELYLLASKADDPQVRGLIEGLAEKIETNYFGRPKERVKERHDLIRKLVASGYSQADVARMYSITRQKVWAIVHRTSFRNADHREESQ